MSTPPFDRSDKIQVYLQSLILSLLLHGALVGLTIFLLSDLRLVPQPEPFKWTVSVIETQPAEQQETPASSSLQSAQAARTEAQPSSVEPKPVPQPQPPKPAEPRIVREEVRETKPVERVIPQTTLQSSPDAVHRSAEPLRSPMQTPSVRTAKAHEPQGTRPVEEGRHAQTPSHIDVPGSKQIVADTAPMTEPESSTVSMSPTEANPDTLVPPQEQHPAVTKGALSTSTPEPGIAAKPPAEAEQATETVRKHNPVTQGTATPPEPIPTQLASLPEPSMQAAPPAKADYGWMLEALRNRVEQLKRYPPMARMNHWEGKVILRVVIKEDGELVGLEVVKSSGHAVLDQDALEVIRQASPLKLQQPLGKPQVAVRVPITYKLQ